MLIKSHLIMKQMTSKIQIYELTTQIMVQTICITSERIKDINQDNVIHKLLRSERMTTRSMNEVLISGGTSTKDNINIPKSFKQ